MRERKRREYEKALRRNRLWLLGMLESPGWIEADLHLLVAGRLRFLLADEELLDYADAVGKELRVWGPYSVGVDLTQLLFVFKALVASWERDGEGHELTMREYLDTHLGVATKVHPDRKEQVAYTAREIIRDAANKEGVAHLVLSKPTGLRYVKASEYRSGDLVVKEAELRRIMRQLGCWTVRAIEHVLEMDRWEDEFASE